MRQRNSKNRHAIFILISKYEGMLGKGKVSFPEERQYHELMDYFERECLLERALEVADYAIDSYGTSVSFYHRKAELLLENQQVEQALAILDIADELAPGNLPSVLLRAECLAALGMPDDGIFLLDALKTLATPEELSHIFVCEALIYESLKEYERMFYLLKAALEENPSNNEALSQMWFCVENARKHEESIELHEKILEDDPFNALAWYNLGAAHHYLCNYEEAIESYEYAFLTKEDFEFAYRDCAEVCLYLENYQKALQCYQDVLERFEPDADLFLHIGLCYQKLGNYIVAKTFYQKTLDFDCYCDEAHFRIGECYATQMEWQKAISAFLKAIRIEDRNEDYFARLAEAYNKVGNYKKAEIYFRQAADTAPEEPHHWVQLVNFLMKRRKIDAALDVLDEADENTYGPELLYYRSACLFELGMKKEALLLLEEALYEDFEAHEALFHLVPELEKDVEVRAVISVFQPE
jgi:tetratricopeptide (TPR) repeat protein